MTRLEQQVLNFFGLLEIALGIWMLISPIGNENVIRVITLYSPLWLLGIIFITGGIVSIIFDKKYMWLYVVLVSVPLMFFGMVFVQVSLDLSVFTSSAITYNFLGLYSAIYAGQVYRKTTHTEKILIKRIDE